MSQDRKLSPKQKRRLVISNASLEIVQAFERHGLSNSERILVLARLSAGLAERNHRPPRESAT